MKFLRHLPSSPTCAPGCVHSRGAPAPPSYIGNVHSNFGRLLTAHQLESPCHFSLHRNACAASFHLLPAHPARASPGRGHCNPSLYRQLGRKPLAHLPLTARRRRLRSSLACALISASPVDAGASLPLRSSPTSRQSGVSLERGPYLLRPSPAYPRHPQPFYLPVHPFSSPQEGPSHALLRPARSCSPTSLPRPSYRCPGRLMSAPRGHTTAFPWYIHAGPKPLPIRSTTRWSPTPKYHILKSPAWMILKSRKPNLRSPK